jgi:serine protease
MPKSLLTLAALCAVFLSPPLAQLHAQTVLAHPDARVIVKYKADSLLLRKRADSAATERSDRAEAMGMRVGLSLRAGESVAERTEVLLATGIGAEELAARIKAQSDVEYAVPDQRRRRTTVPNDPLYLTGPPFTPALVPTSGGPVAGQWYLRAPAGDVQAGANVEAAWNLSIGSPNVVVAVLDTGVRFDHPDLQRAAAGGNVLPGYDMISDVDAANDGDGRDADASDPGDWVTLAEIQNAKGPFFECAEAAENSSWHGTQTSGLIGALTNNGVGMASVGRNVRILPVRVLGKCGGFDSDIIAGMRWAAGLAVPGVPANPNPAKVLNLSLGGEGACTQPYLDAVAEINAVGAVIVAAAGNDLGHAVGTPANCVGVIGVAGLRHVGNKVGFSSLGPEVSLSAPGGNCVDVGPGAACRYPILTTSNAGLTVPVAEAAGGAIYTDSFNASLGTSFSAPLVAGTAALMLSAQPALNPGQVAVLLKATARPFPTTGGDNGDGSVVPVCVAPQPIGATQIDQAQCYCTTTTCGAGMLDAGAAVRAALDLNAVTIVEFYNASLDHYFITWVPAEIAILDAGVTIKGWTRTGKTFTTYTSARTGTSPVCRFYIPPALGDSHFFGRGLQECNDTAVKNPTFVAEDPSFMQMFLPTAGACPAGTVPVYRVFSNRPDANHRYMTDRAVRDQMVMKGWLAEGDGPDLVVMCAPQ